MSSRQQTSSRSLTHLIALNSVANKHFSKTQENLLTKGINVPPSLMPSEPSKPSMPTNKYQVYQSYCVKHSMLKLSYKVNGSKNGASFSELASGNVKNFCCTNSLVLDHDLLYLVDSETNILDTFRNVLASHTTRVLKAVEQHSGREVEQFCFGNVHVKAKPEYVKLDLKNHNSWSKDDLHSTWRQLKKSCCSLCCADPTCPGCRSCLCKYETFY